MDSDLRSAGEDPAGSTLRLFRALPGALQDAASPDRWRITLRRDPVAPMRLTCLHHAGGGASLFKNWADGLDGLAEISAIQLPGRECRWQEPLCADRETVVNAIADTLEAADDGRPLVLFGHSLGAALSFGATHELLARRATPPLGLVLSGSAPISDKRLDFDPADLDDDELLATVLSWGGIPSMFHQHPDLMKRMLPRLRSDLSLARTLCRHRAEQAPLPVPILALGGDSDPVVPVDALQNWSCFTRAGFRSRVLPGGHFFVRDEAPLFQVMSRTLLAWRSSLSSSTSA